MNERDEIGTDLAEREAAEIVNEITEESGFPGGRGNLDDLRRPGAIIAGGQRQYLSVLQQYIHAVTSDTEYRQELKRANWVVIEEADLWCAAYQECKRYGAPVDWLIDRVVARSAGVTGGISLIKQITETISHTTLTTNYQRESQRRFFNRNSRNGPIIE